MMKYLYIIPLLGLIFFSSAHANTLSAYRVGEHDSYTRIVFELSEKPEYSVQKDGKKIRIIVPNLHWGAKKKSLISPLTSVSAVNNTILITLENESAIRDNVLPPRNGKYRLVVDIANTKHPVPVFKPSPYGIEIEKTIADNGIPIPIFKPQARKSPRKPVIVIDAGHGGGDPGALSVSRRKEKYIVLSYAKTLRDTINRTGKYRAVLTRETDQFIKLRDRIKIAHKYRGDLFISIHADSSPNPHARGLSVYTLSEKASDREAALLAARENKADIIMGTDLSNNDEVVQDILINLAQRETQNKSNHFAKLMVSKCRRKINLLSDPHRSAGFAVLKAPDIPSVLVEVGFLSNRKDDRLLRVNSHKNSTANCVMDSIESYFKSYGI